MHYNSSTAFQSNTMHGSGKGSGKDLEITSDFEKVLKKSGGLGMAAIPLTTMAHKPSGRLMSAKPKNTINTGLPYQNSQGKLHQKPYQERISSATMRRRLIKQGSILGGIASESSDPDIRKNESPD